MQCEKCKKNILNKTWYSIQRSYERKKYFCNKCFKEYLKENALKNI